MAAETAVQALHGARVLDLSDTEHAWAGALLADLGAEVRRAGDLGDCDAVVVSGAPSALRARGLDPAALQAAHPALIVAAITPFGLDGPRAEWASSELVAQASGGLVFVNGHAHEPPLRALGPQAAVCAGLQAALGVALALHHRRDGGVGQVVDVSIQESVAGALEHVSGLYRDTGEIAHRQGTLHWSGGFRVGRCRDGLVLLSHLGDWSALIEWVRDDGAAQDLSAPRWRDEAERRAHAGHVFDVLDAWAARYGVAELVERAQLLRLPFAAVRRCVARPDIGSPVARPSVAAVLDTDREALDADRSRARRPAPRAGEPRPALPALAGVRVLDFTWVVAGPLATRVLADHGADVIKIERLDAPDGALRTGALFGNLNRGKRSVAIDLNDGRGRAIARDLARRCDVVVDNFAPRVMANWGLAPADLLALNPGLIVLGLSAFGRSGARAAQVGYGPTLQAELGFTWHMRHPGGAPAGLGTALADMLSGFAGALAVIAALWRRAQGGAGAVIDLAEADVLAATLPSAACPDALGNGSPERPAVLHGVYRCRDAGGRERWCAIAVFDADAGRRLAGLIGATAAPDGLELPLAGWARTRAAEEIAAALQAAGIAAAVVADAADLANDPQLAARGYWITVPGAAGPLVLDGVLPRLSATPGAATAPPPALGAHTDEVLRELLAMEQSAVDRLRHQRVIR